MGRTDRKALERRADAIRSGFVQQGTTLAAWCRGNGFHRPNVRKALMEEWTGPKAAAVVQAVMRASPMRASDAAVVSSLAA